MKPSRIWPFLSPRGVDSARPPPPAARPCGLTLFHHHMAHPQWFHFWVCPPPTLALFCHTIQNSCRVSPLPHGHPASPSFLKEACSLLSIHLLFKHLFHTCIYLLKLPCHSAFSSSSPGSGVCAFMVVMLCPLKHLGTSRWLIRDISASEAAFLLGYFYFSSSVCQVTVEFLESGRCGREAAQVCLWFLQTRHKARLRGAAQIELVLNCLCNVTQTLRL